MVRKIKKILKNAFGYKPSNQPISKVELENRVIESAKQAVKKYPGIFERLAKYDRV